MNDEVEHRGQLVIRRTAQTSLAVSFAAIRSKLSSMFEAIPVRNVTLTSIRRALSEYLPGLEIQYVHASVAGWKALAENGFS